jgi:hypothetical protein
MPRLKFAAKLLACLAVLVVIVELIGHRSPPASHALARLPPIAPQSPDDESREPTEKEMIEWAKREEWVWKDFDLFVVHALPSKRVQLTESVQTPRIDKRNFTSHRLLLRSC